MCTLELSDLPAWPNGLDLETAAAYAGLSPSIFLEEVNAKRAPQPVRLSREGRVWIRTQLDRWLTGNWRA